MKNLSKALAVVLLFAMVLTLLPAMETPASAAATPYITLNNSGHQNPIVEIYLYAADYDAGPYTVSFEIKVENIALWNPTMGGNVSVGVTGTKNIAQFGIGKNQTAGTGDISKQGSNWKKYELTFDSVGEAGYGAETKPLNLLRFTLYQMLGKISIRNVVIKQGNTVKYNMNTDSYITSMMSEMQTNGVTSQDLGDLTKKYPDGKAVWGNTKFGADGAHEANLCIDDGSSTNTTASTNRIPGTPSSSNTTPSSSNTTPSSNNTKPSSNNTKPSSNNTQPSSNNQPTNSTQPSSDSTTLPTTQPTLPTTQPTQPTTNNGANNGGATIGVNPIAMALFLLILVGGMCVILLFATGALGGKKKKKKK